MIPPVASPPSSLIAFADAGASAGDAGSMSAVYASSSCFFRLYPPVASARHPLVCLDHDTRSVR